MLAVYQAPLPGHDPVSSAHRHLYIGTAPRRHLLRRWALRRRLAVRRYNGVGDHVDDLFYSSFPIYDTADTATFAVAVNVEKKLQSLYTKTSRKNIAKFQIYQLNLAKYGYIRTFVSPNGGYTYMY